MWFAQHAEDIKIAQLLGDGYDRREGFYIDIGAWEPVRDSVTKHFYDLGWNGINIEPVPFYFDQMVQARPRDVNLQVAVSNVQGFSEIAYLKDTGLSTFVETYAQKFSNQYTRDMIEVATLTLDDIRKNYVSSEQVVDFLKIDVEGWERQIIEGWNADLLRPKILCIEATEPGTDIPAWDSWDHLVLDRRYEFVEFDGLNRFYKDSLQF